MNPKKLEPESSYARYDTDGDGVVTDDELEISARLQELEMLWTLVRQTCRNE